MPIHPVSLPISGLTAWQGFRPRPLPGGAERPRTRRGRKVAPDRWRHSWPRGGAPDVIGTGRAADRQTASTPACRTLVDLESDIPGDVAEAHLRLINDHRRRHRQLAGRRARHELRNIGYCRRPARRQYLSTAWRSISSSSPIVHNSARSSSGCGTGGCARASAMSRPSTCGRLQPDRTTSRGRRSSSFVHKVSPSSLPHHLPRSRASIVSLSLAPVVSTTPRRARLSRTVMTPAYLEPTVPVDGRVADLARPHDAGREGRPAVPHDGPPRPGGAVQGQSEFASLPGAEELIMDRGMSHFSMLGAGSVTLPVGRTRCRTSPGMWILRSRSRPIPATRSATTPASAAAGPFSEWPKAIGLAAIGDPAVVERFANVARQEYVAVGLVALHPQIRLPLRRIGERSARTPPSPCRRPAHRGFGGDRRLGLGGHDGRHFPKELPEGWGGPAFPDTAAHLPGGPGPPPPRAVCCGRCRASQVTPDHGVNEQPLLGGGVRLHACSTTRSAASRAPTASSALTGLCSTIRCLR